MAKAIKKAPAGAVDRARARALGQEEAPAEPAVLGTPAAAPCYYLMPVGSRQRTLTQNT